MKRAAKNNMPWTEFAKSLSSVHGMIPADATKILDEYRRKYPTLIPGRAITLKPFRPPHENTIQLEAKKIVEDTSEADLVESGFTPPSNYKQSILNRSAVKQFALSYCAEKRPLFKRVSTQFVESIEAEVEAFIRELDDTSPGEWDFLNRKAIRPKLEEKLNGAIRKIITRKISSHPSLGKTLK